MSPQSHFDHWSAVSHTGSSSGHVIALDQSEASICAQRAHFTTADYADRFRGAGYKTIAETLQAFYDLGCLLDDVNLTRMNDGDGLEQTFVSRRAKFHTTCSLKFNKNELQRATKRKTSADEEISPGAKKKYTRQNLFRKDEAADICFFCDKPATDSKPLHKASTLDLDTRVRQCAVNVQDQRLIAKLSERDLIANGAEYHTQCLVSLYNRL